MLIDIRVTFTKTGHGMKNFVISQNFKQLNYFQKLVLLQELSGALNDLHDQIKEGMTDFPEK